MGLPSELTTFRYPDWQTVFEFIMRGMDEVNRPERLHAARAVIFSRLRVKRGYPLGMVERIALNDAIHLLRVLRSNKSSTS